MSDQDTPEQNDPPESTADGGELEVAAGGGPSDPESDVASTSAPDRRRTGKGLYFVVILALAFSFFAASASGFLWWQYRQFYIALDRADSESAVSIQDVRAVLRSLEDRVEALQEADELALDIATDLDRRLEELPGRFVVLEERVNAVQGISDDARRRWLRAEAEYYLAVANTELTLSGRWQNAMDALELADGKLRELASPSLGGVRQRISQELQELRGARLPDIEGLSYSLGRLADRVESLPMGTVAPTSFVTEEEALESAEPGLSRVWLSLKQAISGMINVERSGAPSYRALTTQEQALVRRQLELELQMAKLGLLRSQAEVFQVSLTTARTLLSREFESTDPAVESAITLIEEMLRLDVDPARPDISGSLDLLRGLPARDG